MKAGVSIIVPCFNEEKNLPGAYSSIKEALASLGLIDYEILIFNDFSVDGTGKAAEEIKRKDPKVFVIHNKKNMGFGYNYTEGVRIARKKYVMMVPGDNEIPAEAIRKVLSLAGRADIVIPYTSNTEVRRFSRRVVSRLFVILMNSLFGLGLTYYNGTCLIKSELLKKVPLKTWGFAYMASILVRLLRSGASFVEVGVEIQPRETGKSKAFAPKNIVSVLKAITGLFWEVRVLKRPLNTEPSGKLNPAS